jgi:protein-tyrosine-phosphatase
MNVLFLCTGNSCRSILAEATFNHLAPAGWKAMSAGSKPTGQVHPRSLALLAREGISTQGYASKSGTIFQQHPISLLPFVLAQQEKHVPPTLVQSCVRTGA